MKKTIAIINQKGGVGKTTTAHAIGAGLKRRGRKVLFVDLDAQGNLSYSLGADTTRLNAYDLLVGGTPAQGITQRTKQGDVIPSSMYDGDKSLSLADVKLTGEGMHNRLKKGLQPILDQYDHIIIDTPPALGLLAVNAMTASDQLIIPIQADIYSLHGQAELFDTIQMVRKYANPSLEILGILLVRFNPRAILSRDVAEESKKIAEMMETRLFKTYIRECIAIKEAQYLQKSIFEYAPKSNASKDYGNLLKELTKENA